MIGVKVPYQKPYKEGTPKKVIIEDGFYRDFCIMQTWNELHNMGHSCDLEYIAEQWEKLDKVMALWAEGTPLAICRAKAELIDW